MQKLPADSYTVKEVLHLTGVTYPQLCTWDTNGLLMPSIAQAGGVGKWRLYSRSDVLAVKIASELRRLGMGLPIIRQALAALRGLDMRARGAELFLVVRTGEGAAILKRREVLAALQRAPQGVLIFHLGSLLEGLESGNDAA